MAAFMPAWRPLDATHSVRLLAERPRGGRVVALCVAPGLAGRPEAARLAVGLARRWTEGGLSVVLADGDLARPILHLTVGLANVRGLADLLLGADDWQSLALTTSVPGLKLIPGGGGAPPVSSPAARDHLADLCLHVPADGSALVVYVPLGTMLAEWTLDVCTDIVVLSAEGESVASLFAEDEDRIRAHIGPPHLPLQRAMEPVAPGRAPEPSAEPRGAGAAPAPVAMERGAREAPPEGRPGRSSTSAIEERWAEAAALLRARRAGQAPGSETPAEPAATPEPPMPAAPTPAPKPSAAARPKPSAVPAPKPAAAAEPEPAGAAHWAPEPPRPPAPAGRIVFRAGEPKAAEPAASLPPLPPLPPRAEPRKAAPLPPLPPRAEAPKAAALPPLAPRPARKEEPPDPLATPPIMMAEWDRFGDEEDAAHRAAVRKKLLVRVLAGVAVVAVVAGATWIWMSTRSLPPYEARSTTLPRATIPPAGAAAPAAAPAADTALTVDSGRIADTALAAGGEPTPAAEAAPAGAPPPAAVPETRAPHQRYSWSMAAMGSLDGARSLVERLRRRAPGEAFMIAPIVSDGRTLYRVLAGLAADREELARIREPLGQATGQPAGSWLVREAPLAFSLQDFGDADGATAWVAELARSGVPAYVLKVERDDGSSVWRVYAGAYANEAEAAPMRALIDSAGIRGAALVERKGRAGG